MNEAGRLAQLFLARVTAEPSLDPAALEDQLARMVASAQRRWPRVQVGDESFVSWVAARIDRGTPIAKALAKLQTDDLYLACACAAGIPVALAVFDEQILATVAQAVRRIDSSPDFAAEVRQSLRARLFTGTDPRIVGYSGNGPLVGWVRIAAMRAALNLVRGRRHEPLERDIADGVEALDPELQLMVESNRAALAQAVRSAVSRLSAEERLLLRLHYLEMLPMERIATVQRTSKSSIFRKLTAIRERLADETRRELGTALAISPASVDSLVRLADSKLQLDLGTLLA
jgi:RNA polymerase sigma-70 factor (ECF subfamily)